MKGLIKKYFKHFAYFYKYLRYRIILALLLSFIVGLLDGLGLAMFLPLLQLVSGSEQADSSSLGGLSFIVDGLGALGLSLNIVTILLVIIFFFTLKGVGQFVRQYYTLVLRLLFIRKIRFQNVNFLRSYDYQKFVSEDAGRIQNTLSGESERVTQAYMNYFKTMQSWMMVLVYVSLALITNPQFAILVAIGGALSNLVYRQIYKKTKFYSRAVTTGGHEFQGLLIQYIAFFKYLKATGFIWSYAEKLKSTILKIEDANKKIGIYSATLYSSREVLIIIVVSLVILVQVHVLEGSLGGVILSLMFFYRSLNYILALQNNWNSFLNVSGSLENMNEFVEQLKANKESNGTESFNSFKSEIKFENVSFAYKKQNVLEDVNLVIQKNTTVAFVGESGSGKTTLISLVLGLMDPQNGQLAVDGTNIHDLHKSEYQKRIGYISQDSVIFSDSIYNNITLWAEPTEENLERYKKAIEKAAINEFIESLPEGMDTELGNNGIQVSGGQKQRISIARELYKDVDILVLDEATSALDSETEKIIQQNIDELKGQYTVLIIAHRLSTIKNADEIVLLKKGRIVDKGNYQQIYNNSSSFRKMVELQGI